MKPEPLLPNDEFLEMSEESDTEVNFIDIRGDTESATQGTGKMSRYYRKVKHCFSFIGPAFMIVRTGFILLLS